jgi:hypothetical protein
MQVGAKGLHLPIEGHGGSWEGLTGFSRWHSSERVVNRITRGEPKIGKEAPPLAANVGDFDIAVVVIWILPKVVRGHAVDIQELFRFA